MPSSHACWKHGLTGRLLSSAPPREHIDAREIEESRKLGVGSSKEGLARLSSLASGDAMRSKWLRESGCQTTGFAGKDPIAMAGDRFVKDPNAASGRLRNLRARLALRPYSNGPQSSLADA